MKPATPENTATQESRNQDQNATQWNRDFSKNREQGEMKSEDTQKGGPGELVLHLGDNLKQAFDSASQKVEDFGTAAKEETVSFIKQHPVQLALIGFGAGLITGIVLARR